MTGYLYGAPMPERVRQLDETPCAIESDPRLADPRGHLSPGWLARGLERAAEEPTARSLASELVYLDGADGCTDARFREAVRELAWKVLR